VGTNLREEFNLSDGGENFGYPRHEGTTFFQENSALVAPEPTPPIFDYAYGVTARAAIALATYRPKNYPHDNSFPEFFDGVHFYVDYFNSSLRYVRPSGLGGWESEAFGSGFQNLTDGAVGPDGSLFVITYDGPLRKISYGDTNVAEEDAPLPMEVELRPNHPNPFRGSTTITYRIGRSDHVRIDVFDVLGRRVSALVDAPMPAGVHTVRLDGEGLAAGTYVCRLEAGGATAVQTIVSLGR
jgi:glucose/arabinose dehydrogenase